MASGTASNLVDGATGSNTTDSITFSASAVSGHYLRFDFGPGASKVIQEITWKQSTSASHGTWQVQGSNDGSTWTNIGATFTLGGATTQTITTPSANGTGYRYYQLLGSSGTASSAPWIQEIEFKIAGTILDAVARIPAGGSKNQVLRKSSTTNYDVGWFESEANLFSGMPSSVISLWGFAEKTGSTVYDKIGSSDLSLLATGTPTYTWTGRGLRIQSGVAQMSSQSVRGAFIVYRTKRNATGGFLISGGPSGSGSGPSEDAAATSASYTNYIAGGFGVHTPSFRASTGVNNFEYNRGGWVLAFIDYGSTAASVIGFGGRHSTTTSRCADIEIAAAGVFNAALSDSDRSLIYTIMRKALLPRGIYLSVDDCLERADCIILHGESNPHGDELLSNFSAGDQALQFDNVFIQNVGSTTVASNNARPWPLRLSLNQRLTDMTRAGMELGIAKRWRTNFATRLRRLFILKATLGSTFAAPSGTGTIIDATSWNPVATSSLSLFHGALLRGLYDMEQTLRNQGVGLNVCGVGQSIGLNDAVSTTNTTDAVTYQGYRQDFFTYLQTYTGLTSVKAVIIKTHNSDTASNATALGHVRTAEAALVTANSTIMSLVDADAYTKQSGDAAHFDATGTMTAGEAIYDGLNTMSAFA